MNNSDVQEIERRHQARARLIEWGAVYRQRHALILEAADAGLSKAEIAAITGYNRTHIYDVIKRARAAQRGKLSQLAR
jgi:hypothetical protein